MEEVDKSLETNVGKVQETSATESKEIVEQPNKTETQEEAVEIDGEKLTISQIKKLKEDYANDSKWRDKNRRESEELNRSKDRYKRLELLEPLLEQHPEKLLELIKPQTRDFNKELSEHYQRRNTLPIVTNESGQQQYDPNAYAQWEMNRDRLVVEQGKYESVNEARQRLQEEHAQEQRGELESDAKKIYVDSQKVSPEEFQDMARWIVDNIKPKNGIFPKNSFDLAFKVNHEDKWLRELKLETTQKALDPLKKSAHVDNGKSKPKVTPTPEDEKDEAFLEVMRQRVGKNKWMQT